MDRYLLHKSIHAAGEAEFSRSGGRGGQNVNKVNSRAVLRIRLADLEGLSDAEAARLRETLASRITGEGELIVAAREERSQHVNLERAYIRMETLISGAARLPARRHPTKPSRASREERLRSKHRRALIKTNRRNPPGQE